MHWSPTLSGLVDTQVPLGVETSPLGECGIQPVRIILADRETDLMEVLWDHGPSTVAEVRKRLKARLAYNTVLSILRTLEAKGYVGHEEEGRAFRSRSSLCCRARHNGDARASIRTQERRTLHANRHGACGCKIRT